MATSATEEELKEWQVIYPSYINSKRTIAEGRRLPREHCCENPSLVDMKQVCEFLKLPCEIEVRLQQCRASECLMLHI